jgi:hypothetical protein
MNAKTLSLAAVLAALCLSAPARQVGALPAQSAFNFRSGQSVYIVAFTRSLINVGADSDGNGGRLSEYFDYQLDAEKKVREKFEEWRFFRVADRPSDADFVFLVNMDGSAMEGLALPLDAYTRHFKEKFDIDALRDAAYGRYISGPLKLPTLGRLSDRLVKQFREKIPGSSASSK